MPHTTAKALHFLTHSCNSGAVMIHLQLKKAGVEALSNLTCP